MTRTSMIAGFNLHPRRHLTGGLAALARSIEVVGVSNASAHNRRSVVIA